MTHTCNSEDQEFKVSLGYKRPCSQRTKTQSEHDEQRLRHVSHNWKASHQVSQRQGLSYFHQWKTSQVNWPPEPWSSDTAGPGAQPSAAGSSLLPPPSCECIRSPERQAESSSWVSGTSSFPANEWFKQIRGPQNAAW